MGNRCIGWHCHMPSSTSSPSNNLRCLRFLLSSMVGCNTKQMSTFIFHQILECSQARPQTFHVTQRPNCGTKHLPYSNQIQQPKTWPKTAPKIQPCSQKHPKLNPKIQPWHIQPKQHHGNTHLPHKNQESQIPSTSRMRNKNS